MSKRKTFTLLGEAAGEYVRAQAGSLPQTDDERAARIATVVSLYANSDLKTAAALIKCVAKDGLEVAAKVCTAKRTG